MGSTKTSATSRVNIISDEIIRPPKVTSESILRAYLDKGVNKCLSKDATISSRDVGCKESQLNLLDGLGEDFLAINPPKDIEEFYLQDLGEAFLAAEPFEFKAEEIVQQVESISQVPAVTNGEVESALLNLEKASHQTPSTSIDFLETQDRPLSPIIGRKESKRKMRKGGKGSKKVCRGPSKDTLSSTSSTSESLVFSQAEDNIVVQNFKKLIAVAAQKKKYYEGLEEESRRQRESIVRRKEQAEAQQQLNENNLHQALEQQKQLKKTVAEKRVSCRESNKLIELLKVEEKKIMMTDKYNQEQLDKYSKRFSKLQKITLEIL